MPDAKILAPRLRRWRWLGAIAIAACALGAAGGAVARGPQPGQVDYYALALSWSPTYCGSNSGQDDVQQCGRGRRYGFVLHGLWPQWQRGWPEFCATGSSWLAEDIVRRMLDIMPSRQLVIREWKKHGTCSGLDQQAYFALARRLFSMVRIPARYRSPQDPISAAPSDLVADFAAANPGLAPAMVAVSCGNRRDHGRLQELRICFDRDGAFSDCGPNEARQCRARELVLPPVR